MIKVHSQRWLKWIGIGVFLCAAVLWYLFWPRQFVVELREDGFHPSSLHIPSGSTVVFKNATTHAFWPASNFHPSHKLYPDFDAKNPLPAGSRWSFTFQEAGIWRYHDHLNSQRIGTLVVRNNPWIAADAVCTGAMDDLPVKLQERCWIQTIESALEKKGVDAAFAVFGQLYETKPAFSSDCHDVTHLLGEAAFREYVKEGKVVDTVKTSYCGYGFYHGFIEALLFTTGNFEQAKQYCREVQHALSKDIVAPNAIYSCYHGLGHGTFDTQSFSQWGSDTGMLDSALRTCEKVTANDEPELQKQCATGVFNALANAYHNKTYSLDFDGSDPWGVCERQGHVEYKKACFREVAASYIKSHTESQQEGLREISSIADQEGAMATMYAYMSEEARLEIEAMDVQAYASQCENLPVSYLIPSCVEGVATGLFLWGTPGHEHEKAVAFCSAPVLSLASKEVCFGYVLPRIKTVYTQTKVVSVCETMEPKYRKYCL